MKEVKNPKKIQRGIGNSYCKAISNPPIKANKHGKNIDPKALSTSANLKKPNSPPQVNNQPIFVKIFS